MELVIEAFDLKDFERVDSGREDDFLGWVHLVKEQAQNDSICVAVGGVDYAAGVILLECGIDDSVVSLRI